MLPLILVGVNCIGIFLPTSSWIELSRDKGIIRV